MKLRLQSDSIRLRLKKGEVARMMEDGTLSESVTLGPEATFRYTFEASDEVSAPEATLEKNGMVIRVPAKIVRHWATSDEVGIDAYQAVGNGTDLRILIEKDFACLDGPPEENVDTFPNPLADTKCRPSAGHE